MEKPIEKIENKSDYLEKVHNITRRRSKAIIREIVEFCKDVDLDKFDNSSCEYYNYVSSKIRNLSESANCLMEIAGILFEFDTMCDYRIRNKDSLNERINSLIEGYELGTYKR